MSDWAGQGEKPWASVNPRQIGVRLTGSYWGAAGEQIDMHPSNLNYTQPLVKAQGRGDWGVRFPPETRRTGRSDASGPWLLGRDVGYGFGWRLQAGSVRKPRTIHYSGPNWVESRQIRQPYKLEPVRIRQSRPGQLERSGWTFRHQRQYRILRRVLGGEPPKPEVTTICCNSPASRVTAST